MKYVVLIRETGAGDTEREEVYGAVDRWFAAHADAIRHTRQLKSVVTATTVRWAPGQRGVVLDGPYCDERTAVSGYIEVEVAGLEDVLRLVSEWPADALVEVRPFA